MRLSNLQFFASFSVGLIAVAVLMIAGAFGIDVISAALVLGFVHVGIALGVALLMIPFLVIAGIIAARARRQ